MDCIGWFDRFNHENKKGSSVQSRKPWIRLIESILINLFRSNRKLAFFIKCRFNDTKQHRSLTEFTTILFRKEKPKSLLWPSSPHSHSLSFSSNHPKLTKDWASTAIVERPSRLLLHFGIYSMNQSYKIFTRIY